MPEKNLKTKLYESFENIIKKEALPPSMLFLGPFNSGKIDFAAKLTMALNCMKNTNTLNSCQTCRNCRRIKDLIYPDFIIIQPQGKFIKVDQIRELKKKLALKPHEAKKRIILIQHAQLLRQESANALLKIMEEPPKNTHFILTCENISMVLPTIKSRCHIFRFLSDHITSNGIKTNCDDFFNFELIETELLENTKNKETLFELIRVLMHDDLKNLSLIILAGEYFSAKKDDINFFLVLLIIFFRDILVYQESENKIFLKPLEELISECCKKFDNEKIFQITETVITAKNKLNININPKILIESLLLKIQAAIHD